jgi:uncharacterized protein involved in exopolysaccharide biosynthesis
VTPFGRSRQREEDAARAAANGDVPAHQPVSAAPRFPAPAPGPREPARDTGPWGTVGGEATQATPPHGTPLPDFANEQFPAPAAVPPVERDAPREEPADAGAPPERPFRGPLESALRHPFLATIPVIVLVGIAAFIGLTRDPTYTAESRISVGRVDVPAYTLQGVIVGNATLASGYARTIDAEPVVGPAGNAVGLSPSEARDRLSASPIPETTLIRVEADGPDQAQAVRLSNAGSRSLINYVEDLNRQQQSSGLLRQFRAARARVERSKTTVDRLAANPRPNRARLEKARLDFASAQLQADTLGNQYRALQGGPDAQNLLQFVAPAAEAKSDRRSMFQRLLLIGLAAGVLVGLALALLRENSHLIGRRGT